MKGEFLVNLAGDGIKNVGFLKNIKAGNYKSLNFTLKKATYGPYKDYSIIMIGKANKDSISKSFVIKLNEEILFDGKEGYVGETIKGIVNSNDTGSVEMTFHFDHIFGDIEASVTNHINTGSVGFEFFNRFSTDSNLSISQTNLIKEKDYHKLLKGLKTLGHLGEGHCEAITL